jgi:glycosyltransferase involved in cell wall biosynthesis
MRQQQRDILNSPKISVITATYNSVHTLESTIQSVIAQHYPNLEYIIVDGGSTDGTIDIIRKYEQYITKWVSEKDEGLYDAMNKGIALSTGEWIAFLNSDDVYVNSPLQTVANTAVEKPHVDVVYANAMMESDVRPSYIYKSKYPISKNDFWRTPIIHPSMFTKRAALEKVGYFSTNYRIGADYELVLRLFLAKSTFYYYDAVWVSMRGGGLSERKWAKGMYEILCILHHKRRLNAFILFMLSWCFIKTQCTMRLEKYPVLRANLQFYRRICRKKYRINETNPK